MWLRVSPEPASISCKEPRTQRSIRICMPLLQIKNELSLKKLFMRSRFLSTSILTPPTTPATLLTLVDLAQASFMVEIVPPRSLSFSRITSQPNWLWPQAQLGPGGSHKGTLIVHLTLSRNNLSSTHSVSAANRLFPRIPTPSIVTMEELFTTTRTNDKLVRHDRPILHPKRPWDAVWYCCSRMPSNRKFVPDPIHISRPDSSF